MELELEQLELGQLLVLGQQQEELGLEGQVGQQQEGLVLGEELGQQQKELLGLELEVELNEQLAEELNV